MIAKLVGRLDETTDNSCIIDVSGVGYLVFCSGRTLNQIGPPGDITTLLIETQVREDHIHLYGFLDATERDCFKLLLGVQGVGAKVALGILSTLTPSQIIQAIILQDKAMITRGPGIGPKLGSRIVTELKEKASNLANVSMSETNSETFQDTAGKGITIDAISAIVNLGYRPAEAHRAVQTAATELGHMVELQTLIRATLRHLAP